MITRMTIFKTSPAGLEKKRVNTIDNFYETTIYPDFLMIVDFRSLRRIKLNNFPLLGST